MSKLPVFEAKRNDTGELVRGRIGHPHAIKDGKEVSSYFHYYDGKFWCQCTVITDTIKQIN